MRLWRRNLKFSGFKKKLGREPWVFIVQQKKLAFCVEKKSDDQFFKDKQHKEKCFLKFWKVKCGCQKLFKILEFFAEI